MARLCHCERLVQGQALRREQLRSVGRDMQLILQPHAKFAGDVDSRLVAEAWA